MSKSSMMKYKIDIMGNNWTLFIMNESQFKKLSKKDSRIEDCRAITFTKPRQIYFNCNTYYLGDNVAIHELVHAYAHELFHHDLAKNEHQTEEFFCVLFEVRGKEILNKAASITKNLAKCHKKIKDKTKPAQEEEVDE